MHPAAALLLTLLASDDESAAIAAIEAAVRATPPEEMARLGREAVAPLSSYRYRLTKRERVGGRLLEEQQIETFVRQRPFAVRLEYVSGPAKDRRVVYNPVVRPGA